MNLSFSGRGLAFLAHYMADHLEIRYYLAGIHVTPLAADAGGGVLGVATNGHVLAVWRDPDGQCSRPATLRVSKQLARACKPGRLDNRRLVLRDNRLMAADGAAEFFVQPNASLPSKSKSAEPWEIEGAFPDFMHIVSGPAGSTRAPEDAISYRYLQLIGDSFRDVAASKKFGGATYMRQAAAKLQILVTFPEDLPEAAVIVMPMACYAENLQPKWMAPALAARDRVKAAKAAPLPVYEPSDATPPPDHVMQPI